MHNPVRTQPSGLNVVQGADGGKPRVLQYENLDDRREIWTLLHRLHPRRRVAFFERCCRASTLGDGPVVPRPGRDTYDLLAEALRDDSADRPLTNDIYTSLWTLSVQYHFPLDRALAWLVEMARGHKH
jgi:hypothetical protein